MVQPRKTAGAELIIDLNAIRFNYCQLRQYVKPAICAAVVKANAYGLGAAQVARALAIEGCRHFFVTDIDEALHIQHHLPANAMIFLLHGLPKGAEAEGLAHHLVPVLNSYQQVQDWSRLAAQKGQRLPAVPQLDSGMSRLGLSLSELKKVVAKGFMQAVELRFVMSHLACADQPGDSMNARQLKVFNELRQLLPPCPASLANSAGIFLGRDYHFQLVRPGAALYGLGVAAAGQNPMKPVVQLRGTIIQTRQIKRGDGVGYGQTYRAADTRKIATVAVGYADGWLRSLSNRGHAAVAGTQVPIVGIVSMDTITLDVTNVPPDSVLPGAYVDLISEKQTVDAVANQAGTIGYEILTSLGNRYQRVYLSGCIPAPAIPA